MLFKIFSKDFTQATRITARSTRMTSYGSLSAFDAENGQGKWEEYEEVMDEFFVANDITTDAKKRSVFISCCGQETYSVLKNLCCPDKPKNKDICLALHTSEESVQSKANSDCRKVQIPSEKTETRAECIELYE